MEKMLLNGKEFSEYEYSKEKEFEADVVNNSKKIFGEKTFYIDLKKLLSDKYKNNRTIPDGYLLDYTFETMPRLYLVENELSTHPVREHIANQLLKFAYSYKNDLAMIKKIVMKNLLDNNVDIDDISKSAGFRNADDMFNNIIIKEKFGVIIVIDEITDELNDLKMMLNFDIQLLEFKKFINENQVIFHYDKFSDDSLVTSANTDTQEIPDTILVAAKEEGFKTEFLGNKCWYAVAINISMLDKLKYIAVYQKSPIKAVTYYAEIAKIDLYENTGKYIIYFKGEAKKLKRPIPIDSENPIRTPRGRVYTNISKILESNDNTTVADLY